MISSNKRICENDELLVTWVDEPNDDTMIMTLKTYNSYTGRDKLIVKSWIQKPASLTIDCCNSTGDTVIPVLKGSMGDNIILVQEVEEKLADYIYEMDRYFILEVSSYIYDFIIDKAYDIADKVITDAAKEDYVFLMAKSDAVEELVKCVDYNSLYKIIDEIVNTPVTMEGKLSEIGMSIHDFI